MFGLRLSLAVLGTALVLGSTASEAEARHCRHQRHQPVAHATGRDCVGPSGPESRNRWAFMTTSIPTQDNQP